MDTPKFNHPPREPDLVAEVTYLTTDLGGRKGPVASGYRPSHDFGLLEGLSDGMHQYPNNEWVYPGQSVRTNLWFLSPDLQIGRLSAGFEFTVQEGSRIVGHGKVANILNKELIAPHS